MKNAKKIVMATLMVALVLISACFVSAAAFESDSSALRVSYINQDPDPARPGEYVTLKFKVENQGQANANDVYIEFDEAFPFSLDPGMDAVKSIGSVGPVNRDDDAIVVEYRVRVASEAVEGMNEAKIEFWSGLSSHQTVEFDVEVKTQDSGLAIKSVDTENMIPGSKGTVTLVLENPSDSVLRDVEVSIELDDEDLPLVPSDSASTKRIKFLQANSESSISFGLIPFPAADTKAYKVPITITYYDSTNQLVTKTDLLGIVISADAEVSYYIEADAFSSNMNKGTVTLTFINKGLTDVKFLDVIVEDTEDYEVVSSKESYIGNIDSDDYETTDFVLMRKSDKTEFDARVLMTYKDANNNEYASEAMLPVKLAESTVKGPNWGFITIVIVAIVGFFWYRRSKKKRRK